MPARILRLARVTSVLDIWWQRIRATTTEKSKTDMPTKVSIIRSFSCVQALHQLEGPRDVVFAMRTNNATDRLLTYHSLCARNTIATKDDLW